MVECYDLGYFLSYHEALLIYLRLFGKKRNFFKAHIHQKVEDIFKDFDPSLDDDIPYEDCEMIAVRTSSGKNKTIRKNRYVYYKHTLPPGTSNDEILKISKEKYLQGFEIHHIDGRPSNNAIENLYETTREEHKRLEGLCFLERARLVQETLDKVFKATISKTTSEEGIK